MSSRSSGLPPAWDSHWTLPATGAGAQRTELEQIRALATKMARATAARDCSDLLGPLVGSNGLRELPVHRWFAYKEGFSPALLETLIELLDVRGQMRVIDTFGGVGTTALAGLVHPQVTEVRSVEYSPLAHFIGSTKLRWPELDQQALESGIEEAIKYRVSADLPMPTLSSFSRREIFEPARLRSLVAAREHIRRLDIDAGIRDTLLLGLASVVEDLSGVMKDGRALRIKRDRKRRASSLAGTASTYHGTGIVKRALAGQWTAMAADVRHLQDRHGRVDTDHRFVRGDARSLGELKWNGVQAFPPNWGDLAIFSPPYLNCLDYTELYKLELWLLELVTTQEEFRETRLGTLRSHPSVRFAPRHYLEGREGPTVDLIDQMAKFASAYGRRNDVGPTIRSYFEDMYQVWVEQFRVIRPGGVALCVVANSTFSRRSRGENGSIAEEWRMPVLTDVVLAKLAELAGFHEIELIEARRLRPRNASSGSARESVVVARKPVGGT